jgi:hypothetical protein
VWNIQSQTQISFRLKRGYECVLLSSGFAYQSRLRIPSQQQFRSLLTKNNRLILKARVNTRSAIVWDITPCCPVPSSRWFLLSLFFDPGVDVLLRNGRPTELHGVISQNIELFIAGPLRTSNPRSKYVPLIVIYVCLIIR